MLENHWLLIGKLNIALDPGGLQKPMKNSSGVISMAFCGCCRVGDNFRWNIFSEPKIFNWLTRFSISAEFRRFSFCRSRGFLILQKNTGFRRFAQHEPLGVGTSRRNVWKIQKTKKKPTCSHFGVRPACSRQQALFEARFCRILQNSAGFCRICRILQSSA